MKLFLLPFLLLPAVAVAETGPDTKKLIEAYNFAGEACLPGPTSCQDLGRATEDLLNAGMCPRRWGQEPNYRWNVCPETTVPWAEVKEIIEAYRTLNDDCRGSNDPEIWKPACEARDAFDFLKLYSRGWCYGREQEYGFQMTFHGCEPDSFGFSEMQTMTCPPEVPSV